MEAFTVILLGIYSRLRNRWKTVEHRVIARQQGFFTACQDWWRGSVYRHWKHFWSWLWERRWSLLPYQSQRRGSRGYRLWEKRWSLLRVMGVLFAGVLSFWFAIGILSEQWWPPDLAGLQRDNLKELGRGVWTLITVLVSAPVAFVIWCLRDHNHRQQLENQRRDNNLKDFQQLIQWASGLHLHEASSSASIDSEKEQGTSQMMDRSMGSTSLQIAAISQLAAFARGDFGRYFQRSAFALLQSLWRALMKDHPWNEKYTAVLAQGREATQTKDNAYQRWQSAIRDTASTPLAQAIARVLVANHGAVLRDHKDELADICFIGLNTRLTGSVLKLKGCDLRCSNWQGADLSEARLKKINLCKAKLQGANLSAAHLPNTKFCEAELQGVDLSRSDLQDVDFRGANLQGAILREVNLQNVIHFREAELQGVDLSRSDLQDVDFRGANLQGAILREVNLQNVIHFREAELQDADLCGANLQKMNLDGISLQKANLGRVNLEDANLHAAKLQNVDLRGADLSGVNLCKADLREANLRSSRLQRADLHGANLQNVDLSKTDLRTVDLSGVNLQGADLRQTNLEGVDLNTANLQGVDLRRVKLEKVNLSGLDLSGADFRKANLRDQDLSWTCLQGANFSEADLRSVNFNAAKLQGANFSDAKLAGVKFRKADLPSTNLSYKNLQGVNFRGANLQNADLSGANLQYADLTGADLQDADLSEADLQGANLSRIKLQGTNLNRASLQNTRLIAPLVDLKTVFNDARCDKHTWVVVPRRNQDTEQWDLLSQNDNDKIDQEETLALRQRLRQENGLIPPNTD